MDDPSAQVRRLLLDEFARMGTEGVQFLTTASQSSNRLQSWHARWYLNELERANPIVRFQTFIRSQNYDLESGCLLMACVANKNLETGEVCKQLDQIAARCRQLLIEPASPRDHVLVINRVLFHELGFKGNRENYSDPQNSFIDSVLESKTGLPITLSIIYILVGLRLGIEFEGIALPGHFLVGCYSDPRPIFIDPFEGGKLSTSEQLISKNNSVMALSALGLPTPVSIREILCRCCRNLVHHYSQIGQASMAQLFHGFMIEMQSTDRNHAES